jgi:enamine deaminase RidA (YjgF/YER057c/UK114 family)
MQNFIPFTTDNRNSTMNTLLLPIFFLLALFSCNSEKSYSDYQYEFDVYERLEAHGIILKNQRIPSANYVLAIRSGNLVFLAGHGPDKIDGTQVTGKMGTGELTLEEGRQAARLTGISLLTSLHHEIGDLNRVRRIVKVVGMVNADPSFTLHSQVINGFSDLMVDLFGENGRHARTSIGMSSLPGNITVEINMIVEIKD